MKNIFFVLFSFFSFSQLNAQWNVKYSGTSEKLTSVVVIDSVTSFAAGGLGALLKTTDAGETWIDKAPVIRILTFWNALSFYDKNIGVVAGNEVMITEDGGENWILKSPGNNSEFLCAAYARFYSTHKNYIYLGDDSGYVWQSPDTGKTWTSEKIADERIYSIFVRYDPMYHYPLCTVFVLTPKSLYTKTELPSSSWKEQKLEYFNGLGSSAYAGDFNSRNNLGYIVGVKGDFLINPGILRNQYPDTIWQPAAAIYPPAGALHGVSAPGDSVVYTCGSLGIILKSTDKGITWEKQSVPAAVLLNSIYFLNDDMGCAVGDSGTILFTKNGGVITGTEYDELHPDDIFVEQNYPNPFNPSTTIRYSLSKAGNIRVTVYNLLGSEIITLINSYQNAGSYSSTWNAVDSRGTPVSSGIYFYVIEADKRSFIRKMMYLK